MLSVGVITRRFLFIIRLCSTLFRFGLFFFSIRLFLLTKWLPLWNYARHIGQNLRQGMKNGDFSCLMAHRYCLCVLIYSSFPSLPCSVSPGTAAPTRPSCWGCKHLSGATQTYPKGTPCSYWLFSGGNLSWTELWSALLCWQAVGYKRRYLFYMTNQIFSAWLYCSYSSDEPLYEALSLTLRPCVKKALLQTGGRDITIIMESKRGTGMTSEAWKTADTSGWAS